MTTQNIINALNNLYETAFDGRYIGFILEDLAEFMHITPEECDELIDAAEDEGVLYYDGDLYNATDLAEYEREEEEYERECETEAQAYMDAARGWYAFAC